MARDSHGIILWNLSMGSTMKVTIKDVAKDCGVSPSTVSRVIADNPNISQETKDRVNESIRKLNYKPNIMARGLVNNKTKIIGVIMPNEATNLFSNPFFTKVLRGISTGAEENNYYIMYAFGKSQKQEIKAVKDFVSSGLVDGICLLTIRENDSSIKYLKEQNFPFVVIGEPEDKKDKDILWVDNNNYEIALEMVEILSKKNIKKLGFIGAKKNWRVSLNRLRGFLDGCRNNNISYEILQGDEFSKEVGYNLSVELFKNFSPEGIITTDDVLAYGVEEYLNKNNLKDIHLFGFNNNPLGEFLRHPLNTVEIHGEILGHEAIDLLIKKLKNEDSENNFIVQSEIILKNLS